VGSQRDESKALTIAAAANLTTALPKPEGLYRRPSRSHFQLRRHHTTRQQIENGAPFDVFAAADAEHIKKLRRGKLDADSEAVYALGQLALMDPNQGTVKELKDLEKKEIRFIAVAKPELAPYGQASVEH